MKILFYLHHPAHFHLFKHSIRKLIADKHDIRIVATKKDVLEDLIKTEGWKYENFLPHGRKDNKFSIAFGLLKQDLRLLRKCILDRPDLLIGTSTEICHIGYLLRIKNIFVNEDDADIIPLVKKLAHPFAKHLLSPDVCETGEPHKTITYRGYHELAYLHPNVFSADKNIVRKYFNPDEKYFILRFAKLKAHHDSGVQGIDTKTASRLIEMMSKYGKVYITAERELEKEFEPYRLNIKPIDMHHVMAFASLYIGDSQTMAAEAGVLGIPFIRYNDFVGRIGYLRDIEETYGLGYGIKPGNQEQLLAKVEELLNTKDLKEIWEGKRKKMLNDKIDVTDFFIQLFLAS
ncbi:MAG: DUF354 domain-containing protein [Bacteroidota bacterium]